MKNKKPTDDQLLKEYEFCQNKAQSMEVTIWQTSAVIGIGLSGTFIYSGTRTIDNQLPWQIALIIGFFISLLTILWWFTSRRWWSIQHAMFLRMRHIEDELGLKSNNYIKFLDHPENIPSETLPEYQVAEIKNCAQKKPCLGHQKYGVQQVLRFFPWLVCLSWLAYTIILFHLQ